jgi:predicted dehydrogenase
MLKIGLLGSDNSHADRFSEILNLPEHASYQPDADAQVVAIWGEDAARTQAVAQANRIAQIVSRPEEMLGQVDAVFCVTRHGGLHLPLVRPFLQAGVATFVDKPLAVEPDDARTLVALAAQSGAPFASFSTVRFAGEFQQFLAAAREVGDIRMGSYTGPATRRNPYGGLIFYAIHCIELMLMTQSTGVQWVQASEGPAVDQAGNGALVAVCAWPDGAIATLECPVDAKYIFQAQVLGRQATLHRAFDISDCYATACARSSPVYAAAPAPLPLPKWSKPSRSPPPSNKASPPAPAFLCPNPIETARRAVSIARLPHTENNRRYGH